MSVETHRFSISQVTQGNWRFLTCTIPSDVLASCCFVTTREEDPKVGFQRKLDKKRAEEIARYIDSGLGTIPSSIILSAQPEADLKIIGKGKTVEFNDVPNAFLILDGQHRVYGFSLAKSHLRVPVVIYNNLSRTEESKLFIDINSKQKGVSNELLLDIKKLAEYENTDESLMREIFDLFGDSNDSVLLNRVSASDNAKGKISRVTFNRSLKPILPIFRGRPADEVYEMLNNYLKAFEIGMKSIDAQEYLTGSIVFNAIISFFQYAASKVKDRYGSEYSVNNFYEVMQGMFSKLRQNHFSKPGTSYKDLVSQFESNMKSGFAL